MLAPVAALAAAGCMASKSDIRLLQDEIRTLRAMQSRADTARKSQADSALVAISRTQDSLRALAQRFGAFQATVGGELFEMGKQLITIQELAGMSSKRIMELRSTMEERAQVMTGGDSAAAAAPGPGQLYMTSFDLLRRGSYGAARAGFEELLRRFPEFEEASAAQLYIGQSYAEEKRTAEADSVYGLVVTKYPRSKDAPTALYKYGLSQLSQGKTAAARVALQRVVREFPLSTEADLARSRLQTLR
ncbi:MAG: tetratricopeptide repeat protein [Gemmatimonadaceae bacterium]